MGTEAQLELPKPPEDYTPAYAEGRVDGMIVSKMLVDSGANMPLISKVGLEKLQRKSKKALLVTPATRVVKGLGGQATSIQGYVTAPLELAGARVENVEFAVVERIFSNVLVLIGTKQLTELGASMNFMKKVLKAGGKRVPLNVIKKDLGGEGRMWCLASSAAVSVMGRSVTVVRATVRSNLAG
jgi:hypothetical protein